MGQVKLLKIASDGIPLEHTASADDVTFLSFTVNGGGPVLSGTGLDMNNTDITDVQDLAFTDPSTGTINQTAGDLIVDNIMAKERENLMTTAGSVTFPVITDTAGQVDAFRLPAIAGIPTAVPANGGEGHLVWDSSGNRMFAYNGTVWDDLSTTTAAERLQNIYTAANALTAGQFVYISAADSVDLADVSAAGAPSRVVGVALETVLAAAPVDVISDGVVGGIFAGLTAGARYYADPASPGGYTATVPSGSGNTICMVGYAKNATDMHLNIQQLGRRS